LPFGVWHVFFYSESDEKGSPHIDGKEIFWYNSTMQQRIQSVLIDHFQEGGVSMILIIAEKPSLGRNIADGILWLKRKEGVSDPKPLSKRNGYLKDTDTSFPGPLAIYFLFAISKTIVLSPKEGPAGAWTTSLAFLKNSNLSFESEKRDSRTKESSSSLRS
jgi:hypothetical protein